MGNCTIKFSTNSRSLRQIHIKLDGEVIGRKFDIAEIGGRIALKISTTGITKAYSEVRGGVSTYMSFRTNRLHMMEKFQPNEVPFRSKWEQAGDKTIFIAASMADLKKHFSGPSPAPELELLEETAISRIKSMMAQINDLAEQNDVALRVENNTLKASVIQRKDI